MTARRMGARLADAGLTLLRQGLLLAAITVAVFALMRVVPGDVVDAMAMEGSLDEDAVAALRADLGLDAGVATQFRIWVERALGGDLGLSLRFDRPVAELILAALPATLALGAMALFVGLALGIALPAAAVLWPRSPFPALVEAVNLWSIALPTFCVGLAGILVFSVWLGWLPVIGQMLLPVLILGIDNAGQIAKPLHEDLKEAATAAHIRTARAKGLSPARVVLRHLLPNAMTTVVALGGMMLAGLIGGTLTMEVLFGLPGLGTLAYQAVSGRDYPVIQAVVMVFAAGVVAVNLLADQVQILLDPRLRR
jgi:peptide/nickel transport system permease protein